MIEERGVYVLANDHVLDLAIACLNSFRHHNPDVPLCLIPFDGRIQEIRKLQNKYRFTIFDNEPLLRRCDEISRRFHSRVFGHYRKLVMWDGPFDRFVYIDSDTVTLRNLDGIFGHLGEYGFIAPHAYISAIRRWVWKDSIYSAGALTKEQID